MLYVYSNMKCLEDFSVDRVIAFRAITLVIVAVLEYFYLDRELPRLKSSAAMVVTLIAACLYCNTDMPQSVTSDTAVRFGACS